MQSEYRKCFTLLMAVAMLFSMVPVYAQQDIRSACIAHKKSTTGTDNGLCQSYVGGFLDGALLTDTAIIDNFINEKSSFFQRAYQTRAAKVRKPLPATYLAKFCLPQSETFPKIVDTIIENLDSSLLELKPLNHVTYETIKRIYPCEE